jgi:TetR/AcrR family transcriptional regulator, transcriptional repressor for nem operon
LRLTFGELAYRLVGMLKALERKRRLRDPQRTRGRLVQAAFREVSRSGFQSASLDTILAATGVTKGALYYHFDSKEALGYAIVEEIVAALTRDRWLRPMLRNGQPIEILIGIVRRIPTRPEDIRAGCPLLNLAQEMSPLDEQFRTRLERIFLGWQEGVATLLRKGQSQGSVRRDLNPDEAASFLVAMVEGYATRMLKMRRCGRWESEISWAG